MHYSTQQEIDLHKTLTQHIMRQNIKHETEPKTEQVLAIYNTWPQRYLCNTIDLLDWAFLYIRHAITTNEQLWREALEIDGFLT
jgi:hypothetical protein